jgi:hypothetical protein
MESGSTAAKHEALCANLWERAYSKRLLLAAA